MTPPTAPDLIAAMEATWPPLSRQVLGGVTLRCGAGGGKRVSAASLDTGLDASQAGAADLDAALAAGARLFMIGPGQEAADAALAARGFALCDPVEVHAAPVAALAAPGDMAALCHWPPLERVREIWSAGGIGPERLAVMDRAAQPKAAVLGRTEDRPSGAGFVAVAGKIAFLHALEVAPPHRRKGTGRAILQQAAFWAQGHGADWLALAVTAANEPARALYQGLGMQVLARYHYRVADAT